MQNLHSLSVLYTIECTKTYEMKDLFTRLIALTMKLIYDIYFFFPNFFLSYVNMRSEQQFFSRYEYETYHD